MNQADVAVVGGGSAGLAAALAAARVGASTVLIESSAALGGMGVNALVHTLCGLYHPDTSQPPAWLNPGLPIELAEAVMQRCGSKPERMGRVYILRHEPAVLAHIAAKFCTSAPQLQCMTQTQVTQLHPTGSGWQLELSSNQSLQVKAVVDTTGAAVLAALVAKHLRSSAEGARLYRPSYIAYLSGLCTALSMDDGLALSAIIYRAVSAGALPRAALGASFRPGALDSTSAYLTLDLEAEGPFWNPDDTAQTQRIYTAAAELTRSILRALEGKHPAFCPSITLSPPKELGVRESGRWVGDVVLTATDLLNNKRWGLEEVALAGWPLEMRETATGPKFRYFKQPQPAGIPASALRNSSLPGIYFAGRCMSCDHEALASLRVMGTCLATGQAAGRLAASYSAL